MPNNNLLTCLSIEAKSIRLLVVDPANSRVILRELLGFDFELLSNNGTINEQEQLTKILRDLAAKYDLPNKTRLAINLKYLDFKKLFLPLAPDAEMEEIINDEAIRESVFSYSGEAVVVAYQFIGQPASGSSRLTREVLAVTIPKVIIESIEAAFLESNLELTAIQPSLLGLETVNSKYLANTDRPTAILLSRLGDAELYIWEDGSLQFWRYLPVGTANPDFFKNEIITSLAHYQQKIAKSNLLTQIILIGEEASLDLGTEYQLNYSALDNWADLFGLGLEKIADARLNFLKSSTNQSLAAPFKSGWLAVAVLLSILICAGISWKLWTQYTEMLQIKRMVTKLQTEFDLRNKQYGLIKREQRKFLSTNRDWFKPRVLLDDLREIVPMDTRFTNLSFDLEKKTLLIEGICLNQDSLGAFVSELLRLNGVQTIQLIDTVQQEGISFKVCAFKINILLEADNATN